MEPFPFDQRDTAVREFKEILHQQVVILRHAVKAESVYIYWVNRERKQFVLEAGTTQNPSVIFPDRVAFEDCFLNPYKDLSEVKTLEIKKDQSELLFMHHLGEPDVSGMTIVPFVNQGETVALTVLETAASVASTSSATSTSSAASTSSATSTSSAASTYSAASTQSVNANEPHASLSEENRELFRAYRIFFRHLLNNYLQWTSNLETSGEWEKYEASLRRFDAKKHPAAIFSRLLEEADLWMPGATATLVLYSGGRWTSVLQNVQAPHSYFLGCDVQERSMTSVVLERGEPQFAIHFNQNPKILSSRERITSGASYVLPILLHGKKKGALAINHPDPLFFSGSMKHKISNMLRVAMLTMEKTVRLEEGEFLFVSGPGQGLLPDIWEQSIHYYWSRAPKKGEHALFGMAAIDNIREIRSRYRVDTLNHLQKRCAEYLHPASGGFRGFVGFRSDYIFPFIALSETPLDEEDWEKKAEALFTEPLSIQSGEQVQVTMNVRCAAIHAGYDDPHQIVEAVKNT